MHNVLTHRPRIIKIERVRNESKKTKSFMFKDRLCKAAKPGQFSMVWIPDFDEIPMSLAIDPETGFPMIVVKNVGDATSALHKISHGQYIGIRGPYGTFFNIGNAKRILIAAGGIGIIPFLRIASESNKKGYQCEIIMGAKDIDEMIFFKTLQSTNCILYPITEDGSLGEKGLVIDVIKKRLEERYDLLMCCGPELMIKSIIKIARKRNVNVQASLERIMKCGIGICGSCELSGFRVCKDGPVFNQEELKLMKDSLGICRRDHSGKKIKLN